MLKYKSVDAGHGWLIFALPPAEVAVHPSDQNDRHELFLMCDDVQALIAEMKKQKVQCSPVDEQRWGSITRLTLPGGGKLGVYQPRHGRPKPMAVGKPARKLPKRASKKPASAVPKKKSRGR